MIVRVLEDNLNAFKNYIKSNPTKGDDYFVSDEALRAFDLEDNISYMYYENNVILGVLTIMKKYGIRLRYAHVKNNEFGILGKLHKACLEHTPSYKVFLEDGSEYIELFKQLGLTYERTVYALRRELAQVDIPVIPTTYTIAPLQIPNELQDFVDIRNTAFKDLAGSDHRDVSFYDGLENTETYLYEGMLLLKDNNKAIGIINASKEVEAGEHQFYIGPIAVLPEYQGKRLGKFMLAKIIETANHYNCVCTLSVNTDNENALKLYTDLGFYKEKKVIALI